MGQRKQNSSYIEFHELIYVLFGVTGAVQSDAC